MALNPLQQSGISALTQSNMYPMAGMDAARYSNSNQQPTGAVRFDEGGIAQLSKSKKPSEIIMADAAQHGLDAKPLLAQLQQEIHSGKTFLMQKNNSVMSFTALPEDRSQVFCHIYTVDKPMGLLRSLRQFWHELEGNKEIKVVYGKADNPQILELGKKAGWPVEESNRPQFNWMART
jgi:hypothetical protein